MNLEADTPAESPPESSAPQSAGENNGVASVIPEWAIPRVDDLIIEDGRPVDNIYFEKLARILTEPLYSSWAGPGEGRPFAVLADVGLFPEPKQTPLAPDVMLSLDVRVAADLSRKENRSYFIWGLGKPPDVVIEFVSDRRGGEATRKMRDYARIGVSYYVIYDPRDLLHSGVLRAFHRVHGSYQPIDPSLLPGINLGLKLWEGEYEGEQDVWLRWCDRDGNVIPSGRERADEAKQQADEAKQQADEAKEKVAEEGRRADTAEKRAERLAAQLRALGIDPDSP